MEKYDNYLPKPPKTFGSWREAYKAAVSLDGIIKGVIKYAYIDENNDAIQIEFNVLCQYVMQECSETTDKIIKLNEELTAENSRLLEENDIIEEEVKSLLVDKDVLGKEAARLLTELESVKAHLSAEVAIALIAFKGRESLRNELSSIKSKWWYKLMTWRW